MKVTITQKLFFAILTAAGLAVFSMVLIIQWNLNRGFLHYVNILESSSMGPLAGKLEQAYEKDPGWEAVRHNMAQWHGLIRTSLPVDTFPSDEPRKRLPLPVVHHFIQRLFLLDAQKKPLIAEAPVPADSELTPLHHKGKVIGYLGLLPRTSISDNHQKRFLRQQKTSFMMVAGIIILLAAGLSLLLARRLVRPVGELAKATDRLAAGDFTIRIPAESNDELGRLARDFNALAEVLAKNEQARRQWVADISHELRTPLAVLRGEIEALQDGIRQPSAETFSSLHGEAMRLGRLVDDLYQLSLSDLGALTYRKNELDLADLLASAIESHGEAFGARDIAITTEIPDAAFPYYGDRERLQQLFANLLDNARKYTNAGGSLRVVMERTEKVVAIDFQDSAPGVPESDMEKLFERLYRAESSRNRATGGAGLGLAICRNIVEAHGGTITARPSPLGGLWIRIEFPATGVRR
jgi:two-component system sensor histidine kinase BaeS